MSSFLILSPEITFGSLNSAAKITLFLEQKGEGGIGFSFVPSEKTTVHRARRESSIQVMNLLLQYNE